MGAKTLPDAFHFLASSPPRTVVRARQLVTRCPNPRGMTRARAVVTGAVTIAVLGTPTQGAVLPGKPLVAHALTVVADTISRARVRARVSRTIHSRKASVAVTGSVDTITVIGTTIRTFLNSTLRPCPALEAVASAIVTFAVVVAVVCTGANGAVRADPLGRTQALAVHAPAPEGAIVGTQIRQSNHRAIFAKMAREAVACAVVARSLGTTIVGTLPRRGGTGRAREPVLAGTHSTNTDAVVGAHVRTHALVVVDAAVRPREASRTHAHPPAGVAVAVVAAVVGAHLDLTRHAPIAHTAVAPPLEARAVTAALVWAFADSAVGSGEARLTHARAVVAVSVDALGTELR